MVIFLSGEHGSSLDSRLREASRILSGIVEFLNDLTQLLDDGQGTFRGVGYLGNETDNMTDMVDRIWLRPYKVAIGSNIPSSLGSETSEFSEVSGTTKDSITSLMQRLHAPSLRGTSSLSPFECLYCWNLQEISSEKFWRYGPSPNQVHPYVLKIHRQC